MNLLDSFDAHGVSYRKSSKPNEVWVNCPFCTENGESPDTRYRLGINVETGQSNCFNCHWRTRDKEFLEKELNRAFQTGAFELAQEGSKIPVVVHLPEDFATVQKRSGLWDYWNNKAYDYLERRGITVAQIGKHRIGYSMSGKMAGRIVFPVYANRKLKSIVARDFTGKGTPPYLNSVGERALYNVPEKKAEVASLVEGVFDSLAVERNCGRVVEGGLDSLAVLGHSLTPFQLKQLEGYRKFILWPDPDAPGINGFMNMVPELARISRKIYVVWSRMDERDPDELQPEKVQWRLAHMKPYSTELEQRMRAWLAFKGDE